jgi:hypothetical protein
MFSRDINHVLDTLLSIQFLFFSDHFPLRSKPDNQPGIGATGSHLEHLSLEAYATQTDDERPLERNQEIPAPQSPNIRGA